MGFYAPISKAIREILIEDDSRKEKVEQGGGIGSKSVEYELGFLVLMIRKLH